MRWLFGWRYISSLHSTDELVQQERNSCPLLRSCVIGSCHVARTLGELTESALPLLNLLDVLTVNNVYRLHILKFTHLWHKGLLPVLFQNYFQYARRIYGYNTRYASKQNLYKPKERNNTGKQTVALVDLKNLNPFKFSKKLKHYLLSEQQFETSS